MKCHGCAKEFKTITALNKHRSQCKQINPPKVHTKSSSKLHSSEKDKCPYCEQLISNEKLAQHTLKCRKLNTDTSKDKKEYLIIITAEGYEVGVNVEFGENRTLSPSLYHLTNYYRKTYLPN